jgi:NAD(P)-dependent dehydrogenase (short-subunit alcohol dehydrogenase family)
MADVGVFLVIHREVSRGLARAGYRVLGASRRVMVQKARDLAESIGRTVAEFEPAACNVGTPGTRLLQNVY